MKIISLAEKIRHGEGEYPSAKELIKDADRLFKEAVELEIQKQFKQGVEYCRAAREDLDLAHEISVEPEVVYDKKNELALYRHRLQINVYITEQRYQKVLEEVAVARELYEVLEENHKLKPKHRAYMADMSRLEKVARRKLNDNSLPKKIQLQNLQDQMEDAIAEERYEDAAGFKDRIKALEERELAKV
jgi:hypothetical protein